MDVWSAEKALPPIFAALDVVSGEWRQSDAAWVWPVLRRLLKAVAGVSEEQRQQQQLASLIAVVDRSEAVFEKQHLQQVASLTEALRLVQTLHAAVTERTVRHRSLAPRVDPFSCWRFSVHFHEAAAAAASLQRLRELRRQAWGWCEALADGEAGRHLYLAEELAEGLMEAGLVLTGACPLLRQAGAVLWARGRPTADSTEAVERLVAQLLDTRLGGVLETLLTSRFLDHRLVLYVVCGLRPAQATRALTRAMRRVPNSYKVALIVADIAFVFARTLGNAKSQEMGRRLGKIAKWLRRCAGVSPDWGAILHADRWQQGLNVLFQAGSQVDAATLHDFCVDFSLPRESSLQRFLSAKLTWTPPDDGETDVHFRRMVDERLAAAQDAFDLLRAEKMSGVDADADASLEALLTRLMAESDPFDHERIRFLLKNHLAVAVSGREAVRRQLQMVDFLMGWRRVGSASREEMEWLAQRTDQEEPLLFRESLLLSPFARTRLPFHAMLERAQQIIEPEINANNLDRLESHTHLLGMSTDALHMVAVNNLVRAHVAWLRQHPVVASAAVVWRGVGAEVDEALWAQFSQLLQHIRRPKSALTCAQAMASATPSGWERLRALDLCVDFATRWLEEVGPGGGPERTVAERALTKFTNLRRSLSLEGVLHQHGLTDKETLALIRQPDALLRRLLQSPGTASDCSPSLAAAVSVAEQSSQDCAQEAWQLLTRWLRRSEAQEGADLDMTFNFGDWSQPQAAAVPSSDRWLSVEEDEDLQKAVALLQHPAVCADALVEVGALAFSLSESNVCRLRAFSCLLLAESVDNVNLMAARHYVRQVAEHGEASGSPPTLVQYAAGLIYACRMEEFTPCSLEDLLAGDKTEIVRGLVRERRVLNDVHGLTVTAHLLMDFALNDYQLWAFVLTRLASGRFGGTAKAVISLAAVSHALTALPPTVQLRLFRQLAPGGLSACFASATGADTALASLTLARSLGACPILLLILPDLSLPLLTESWCPTARALLLRHLPPDSAERAILQSSLEGCDRCMEGLGYTMVEIKAIAS